MFLIILALIINTVAAITHSGLIAIGAAVPLGISLYRSFSKDIVARRTENQKFLRAYNRVKYFFKNFKTTVKDLKTHRYFKCPKCAQKVRVPRGAGKISIKCPKCGEKFVKKT